jgi:hypothetical protein
MAKYDRENWMAVKESWLMKVTVEYSMKPVFCVLCGQRIESFSEISPDHIVPRSAGGEDVESNLQPSHQKCNTRRGNNILRIRSYYDEQLDADIDGYRYKDRSRVEWNINFIFYKSIPKIEVEVCTNKIGSDQVKKSVEVYDLMGNNLTVNKLKKNKLPYYNHNPYHYGNNKKSRKRGGGR